MDALENLDVWKRSCRLSVDIYKLTEESKEYSFKDQVTRSALSIASNIAEGYERGSVKERIRFCNIAKGSCGECWTQLLIGIEAGFLEKEKTQGLVKEAQEISKMLHGLIEYFKKKSV